MTERLDNPELDAEASNPDLRTRMQRLRLRAATIRMRAAALGQDLELEDWGETCGVPRGPSSNCCLHLHRGPIHCLLSPSPSHLSYHSFITHSLYKLVLTTYLEGKG